jgi:hypothetical protein
VSDLRSFVADLIETEGGAVEAIEPDGLEVLAPEPVRAATGWPEIVRLGFGAQLPPGAKPVGFEGDWIERFGAVLGERGRWAERQLALADPAPRPGDPERLLAHAIDLPNAVWRLRGVTPAWTRCLLLTFRYTAVSDEKREGLVRLGFNQGTGAVVDDVLARLNLGSAGWQAPEPEVRQAAGPGWNASDIERRTGPLLNYHARRELEPFIRAMQRRLDRDRERIHAYHSDLRLQAQRKLAALARQPDDKAEATRKREQLRIAAVEREYAAKIDDLRRNYALRVDVEWVQGAELYLPVQRFEVLVKRRKGERLMRLDWHAAARVMEAPPSEWGSGQGRSRLVCDERLHITDAEAQAPCCACGKAWCRACHPAACPRCGPAVLAPRGSN